MSISNLTSTQRRLVDGCYVALLLFPALFLVAFLAMTIYSDNFYKLIGQNEYIFCDFVKLYTGGKMVLSGATAQIYDVGVELEWLNRSVTPAVLKEGHSMHYPPYDFAFVLPFSLLPIVPAYLLWVLLNAFLATVAFIALRKQIDRQIERRDILTIILLTVSSFAAMSNMMVGQFAFFTMAYITFFFAAFFAKRDILCGLFIALCSVKPQFLPLMLIPALLKKRWKILGSFAVFQVLLLCISIPIVGWQNVVGYLNILYGAEFNYNKSQLSPEFMISLRALLTLIMPSQLATKISVGIFLVACAFIGKLWLEAKSLKAELWAAALSVVIYVLTNPHVHLYDSGLILIALMVTARKIRFSDCLAENQFAFRIWLILLFTVPALIWLPYYFSNLGASRFAIVCEALILLMGLIAYKKQIAVADNPAP